MTSKIIVITAPSGSGKTSIVQYLLQQLAQLRFSISVATRMPRGKEVNGIDYYFISTEEFKNKIEKNEFVEWEMVYEGKYYGTLHSELARIWQEDNTPLVDIDVKGALNIKNYYKEQCLTLFILPPSIEELRKRLVSRGTETEKSLEERLNKASYELSFKNKFDALVINDNLLEAQKQTLGLIKSFLGIE